MGISKYPRPGQRIAPATLREILDVPIRPERCLGSKNIPFKKLSELDERAWVCLSSETCRSLARQVVEQVRRAFWPPEIRQRLLPIGDVPITLEKLDLELRTCNCLERNYGFDVEGLPVQALRKLTVLDLLKAHGFGVKCLVDLLTALESFAAMPKPPEQPVLNDDSASASQPIPLSPEGLPSRLQVEISRYPRVGHRLAPKTLSSLLDVPVDDQRMPNTKLMHLDESAWERFSAQTCRKLAAQVLRAVGSSKYSIRSQAGHIQIPMPRTDGKSIVLQLQCRTFNCMRKAGLLKEPKRLAALTIRDLLALPHFGTKCLVDLLTSLESHIPIIHKNNVEIVAAARRLERMEGSSHIRTDDPRFGATIQSLGFRGKGLKQIAEQAANSSTCPTAPEFYVRKLKDLHSNLCACRQLKLEDELRSLISCELNERNCEMSVAFLGWDGFGRKTLEEVGKRYGITRERVRQIAQRHIDWLRGRNPFLPILDRVLETIAKELPRRVEELEASLVGKGLSKKSFRLDGIICAAEIAQRELPFVIKEIDGQRYAFPPDQAEMLKLIVQIAEKSVSHWGATTLEDVAAQVSERVNMPVVSDTVARILRPLSGFAWLDEASGWFWIKTTGRNALLNQIEKVLCVCERLHVTELRAGVSRHHRREGFAPPQRVLLALCNQAGGYRVDGSFIAADPPLKFEEVLAESEKTIVQMLKEFGPVIERQKLKDLCVASGLRSETVDIYMTYSPVLARYAPGVYGLRGADVPPGVAESLVVGRRKTRVMSDYGWTPDGRIYTSYKLSKGSLSNGIVSAPSRMAQYLQGSYQLTTIDGQPIGQLVVKGSQTWGLGPLFRRRGGETGDTLQIIYDLKGKLATAELGEPEQQDVELVTDVPACVISVGAQVNA